MRVLKTKYMIFEIKLPMTKISFALAILVSCGMTYEAQAGDDDCRSWTHRGYPVSMEICSYPGGGSGYTSITNDGVQDARICVTVVANNGDRESHCPIIAAGDTNRASAFQCGTNTKYGGCNQIILNSYQPVR